MPNRCPESNPPEQYYDEQEARKYTSNTHLIDVQTQLTTRALELCNLDPSRPALVLDIGCGSGLSGAVIDSHNHMWVGTDISTSMLKIAATRPTTTSTVRSDMGQGVPFKSGIFEACVSVSALQWLCSSYSSAQVPSHRLVRFFSTLFGCMMNGGRVVMQFYPTGSHQIGMVQRAALRSGFTGGLVVDYPDSRKAKKLYLCLFVGTRAPVLPQAHRSTVVPVSVNDVTPLSNQKKAVKKSKSWIKAKKESQHKKGLEVRPFSKYSGRKRKRAF